MKHKKKKDVYVPKRGIMGNADDYHVYPLNMRERLTGFAIGGIGGAVVLYLFFASVVPAVIAGLVTGYYAVPVYQRYLLKKRRRELLFQFKDMLESLTSSYSAGKNTRDSFMDALNDMRNMYGDEADIVKELVLIVVGVDNNINMEVLLMNFADRSGLDDIESFANVFEVSLRQGADIKSIIASTRDIISDKVEIELEMETMLAGNKNELNIMMLMPVILCISLRGMSGETFGNSVSNVIVKIVAIGIFAGAYVMGQKLTDIKL